MNRRDFLRQLFGAATLTAAGLVVPSRTTYVFLRDNPLASEPMGLRDLIDDDTYAPYMYLHHTTRRAYLSLIVANRQYMLAGVGPVPGWMVKRPSDPGTDANRMFL